jgi:hypothetical protein
VAESCDGSSDACPADTLQSNGTVCRSSAGVCDVAETCNGTSTTCPTDVTAPDGTSCDDSNACTTGDSCQSGVCTGTPQPGSCGDHYLCYKTRPTAAFQKIFNVTLADQFESITVDVTKFRNLCTPADKNGEGVHDNVTHLDSYSYKAVPGTPRFTRLTHVQVDNQLTGSPLIVDVYKRDILLVPSNKSLSGPTTAPDNNTIGVDHYKCYKAKVSPGTPRFTVQTVSVADQFQSPAKQFVLKKIKHLCTPVGVNGQALKSPSIHLACYLAKTASGQPRHTPRTGVNTANELDSLVFGTIKETELCIPSIKTLTP